MTNYHLKERVYSKNPQAVYRREYRKRKPLDTARNSFYTMKRRLELMDVLGGKICSSCGYKENVLALQIDHKNGGGADEVRGFKGNSTMYRFYISNPDLARHKLQVLCANCNMIKRHENKETRKRCMREFVTF